MLEFEHADLLREGIPLVLFEVTGLEVTRLASGARYGRSDEQGTETATLCSQKRGNRTTLALPGDRLFMGLRTSVTDGLATALADAAGALDVHRAALATERGCLDERDRAIADAVRVGAGLEEVGRAASITRSAASLAARRTLPARPARGGPYARRRGVAPALKRVTERARSLSEARERTAAFKERRDQAIVHAVNMGVSARSVARHLGMTSGAVSIIVRAHRPAASTDNPEGAVASPQ